MSILRKVIIPLAVGAVLVALLFAVWPKAEVRREPPAQTARVEVATSPQRSSPARATPQPSRLADAPRPMTAAPVEYQERTGPPPLPFDLASVPVPAGFEGVPISDPVGHYLASPPQEQIVVERERKLVGPLQRAACLGLRPRVTHAGVARSWRVLNLVDTERGYKIESVQLLGAEMEDTGEETAHSD